MCDWILILLIILLLVDSKIDIKECFTSYRRSSKKVKWKENLTTVIPIKKDEPVKKDESPTKAKEAGSEKVKENEVKEKPKENETKKEEKEYDPKKEKPEEYKRIEPVIVDHEKAFIDKILEDNYINGSDLDASSLDSDSYYKKNSFADSDYHYYKNENSNKCKNLSSLDRGIVDKMQRDYNLLDQRTHIERRNRYHALKQRFEYVLVSK